MGGRAAVAGAYGGSEAECPDALPGNDSSILSGLMRGVAETRGRPAIVDEAVGQGRVVIFSTNPAYRWQNLGEFNMLANSILHFNDFPK